MVTLDSHCDTPMFFDQGINFATRDKKILVDLHKMTEGQLDATIMVAYLKQLERTDEALLAATAKADRILNEIEEMVAQNCTAIDIAYTPAEFFQLSCQIFPTFFVRLCIGDTGTEIGLYLNVLIGAVRIEFGSFDHFFVYDFCLVISAFTVSAGYSRQYKQQDRDY